jgi:hypothetical protein
LGDDEARRERAAVRRGNTSIRRVSLDADAPVRGDASLSLVTQLTCVVLLLAAACAPGCTVVRDLDELGGGCDGVVPGIQGEYHAPSSTTLGDHQLILANDCTGSCILRVEASSDTEAEYDLAVSWSGVVTDWFDISMTCRGVTLYSAAGAQNPPCQLDADFVYDCHREPQSLDCLSSNGVERLVDWLPIVAEGG